MAICLIVEDGTIVENANTYIDVDETKIILENQGFDVSDLTETELGQFILRSAQYIESFRNRYQGNKSTSDQTMQWPRINVAIDDYAIDSDVIPPELKTAQALGAYEESIGNELQSTCQKGTLIEETIHGAITNKWADNGLSTSGDNFAAIDGLLAPLFKSGSLSRVFRG